MAQVARSVDPHDRRRGTIPADAILELAQIAQKRKSRLEAPSKPDAMRRVKVLKATLICLLVLGITALMFYVVVGRQSLEQDRARRAENYRQSHIANARIKAANARRAAAGTTGLESLIEGFVGEEMSANRQKVIRIKDEMEQMPKSGAEWEARKRELEVLEAEINEYDQEMKKLREQVQELK